MHGYARTYVARWADCDANGHLRNTAYSEYAIEVRLSFLAENGFGFDRFQGLGFGPVLLREDIEYRHEIRLGESFTIDLALAGASPDGARFKMRHDFWIAAEARRHAGRLTLSGGWLDQRTRRLVVPPEELALAVRRIPRAEPWEDLRPLTRR